LSLRKGREGGYLSRGRGSNNIKLERKESRPGVASLLKRAWSYKMKEMGTGQRFVGVGREKLT